MSFNRVEFKNQCLISVLIYQLGNYVLTVFPQRILSDSRKFSTVHKTINPISPKYANSYSILLVGFRLSVTSSVLALVRRIIWFLKWQIALGPIKSCIRNVQTSRATGGQAYKEKHMCFVISVSVCFEWIFKSKRKRYLTWKT